VKDEVVAEGVDGGPGGDVSGGQTEADAEGVAQTFGRSGPMTRRWCFS